MVGMVICYAAGQFIAADRFAMAGVVLLVVFVIRLIGGTITWIFTGR